MTMQAPSEPETIVQGASLSTAMAAAAAAFTVTGRARPRLGRQLRALKGALAPLASRSDADGLAPASRWFYDNARMLEEACLQAAEETKRLRPLPAYGRTPRALRLCREACAALEARMDAASLEAAAAAWQQTQPLEEEELAVLPLFARLALLEILSSLAVECARAEADRRAAESEAGLPLRRVRTLIWSAAAPFYRRRRIRRGWKNLTVFCRIGGTAPSSSCSANSAARCASASGQPAPCARCTRLPLCVGKRRMNGFRCCMRC